MPEVPPAPTEELSALRSIAALIKNYEPRFDLQRSFAPGVLGCSDPQYPAIKGKWLDDLDRKGLTDTNALVAKGLLKEVIDDLRADQELSWQESRPADSRINWRVTVHHCDWFIHIMALDKNFERFAFSLQTKDALEGGLTSDNPRPFCHQYKVVNHLSELRPVLDDLYESFKRQDQEDKRRDQEEKIKKRINKAVEEEREKWETRLANKRENRRLVVYLFMFIAVLFVSGYVASAINKHFHGVPGDAVLTTLAAGIDAFFGALLYLWGVASVGSKFGLLRDGWPLLLMTSALIVFFVLWIALAYATLRGLI
jgi:hypothetical protein